MKKLIYAGIAAVGIVLAASAQAKDPKPATVVGELVDASCFLAHAERGPENAACGTECVKAGSPMAVITKGGALYIVTLSHENKDAFANLKTMVGKNVSLTGTVHQSAGVKAIEVTEAKSAL